MDVKQEYKGYLRVKKIMSVISIIFWGCYFLYLSYRAITVGIQNVGSFYWVMGGGGVFFIAFNLFGFRMYKKKIEEIENLE